MSEEVPEVVSAHANIIDVRKFFQRLLPIVLDTSDENIEECLSGENVGTILSSFTTDVQYPVLFVERTGNNSTGLEPEQAREEEEEQKESFSLSLDVHYTPSRNSSVCFIKKGATIDEGKSLVSQLNVVNLGDGSPLNVLRTYLRSAFGPYFQSFSASQSQDKDADSRIGLPAVNKKIAELENSLLHCEQNTQIPDVSLVAHPLIQNAVSKALDSGERPKVEDLGDHVSESGFLNQVQATVVRWTKEIQKVTKLQRDPLSGSSLQEMNFWIGMDRAIQRVNAQLKAPDVELTMAVLREGKRYFATTAFESGTGLKEASETVSNYFVLMKDFPVAELFSAGDVPRVEEAVKSIFNHLRKIKHTAFPIARALALIEVISRDMVAQLAKILDSKRLMTVPHEDFEVTAKACTALFTSWDEQASQFRDVARELVRRRGDGSATVRLKTEHGALQERLNSIRHFRRQHEEFRSVVVKTGPSRSGGQISVGELKSAYDIVSGIDVLEANDEEWRAVLQSYESRIERIESHIIATLRDRLGKARNATEMFRVFARFNVLFFRPRIRGAIQEYQTQLVTRVKEDIRALHEKFKRHYMQSESSVMNRIRDIPPVAGTIIWARQIERQLGALMTRVEDVLGAGWEHHTEGQRLKAEGTAFKAKLNTEVIFEQWVKGVESKKMEVTGRIFDIQKRSNGVLQLGVNFDQHIVTLFKEVRNLQWLGFRVPLAIHLVSSGAKQFYPSAASLTESLRLYEQTITMITPKVAPLVALFHRRQQYLLTDGFHLHWESHKLETYARDVADAVSVFEDKVHDAIGRYAEIDSLLHELHTCPLESGKLLDILSRIQQQVDEFSLGGFSNLKLWVQELDRSVGSVLMGRLKHVLKEWKESFNSDEFVHEIIIRNQTLAVWPPMEDTRRLWLQNLQATLSTICALPRIQSGQNLNVGLAMDNEMNYYDLLCDLDTGELDEAYAYVEHELHLASEYVKEWLEYQALWDMDPGAVDRKCGENIQLWQLLLTEIRRSRTTFDTAETKKRFGPIAIIYATVQQKVNNKYDVWHKIILAKYGAVLGEAIRVAHSGISAARQKLENRALDSDNTSNAVAMLTLVQDMRRKHAIWKIDVADFAAGQRVLERQRFQFPNDWMYVGNVEGEWSAFCELLRRRTETIETQIPVLQQRIIDESKVVAGRITEYRNDWATNKPLRGGLEPPDALNTISIFEGRLKRVVGDYSVVCQAKEALGMELGDSGALVPLQEELEDLRSVWIELQKVWSSLATLMETPWSAVVPRKLRQSLDQIVDQLKTLPTKVRQYAAFEHTQNVIRGYIAVNGLVGELHSEALRERHWSALARKIGRALPMHELTLGVVWAIDLKKKESDVRDVITVAQGEMALEEFIKQVRDHWQFYELELVAKKKCRLIKSWDDLLNKVNEHLGSLSAMHASPYYQHFAEDAQGWEEKLNRVRDLFDTWLDVQRRWVYLEGVFTSGSDIRQLLPAESDRFRSIDNEFVTLMRKVAKNPHVLEVLGLPDVEKTLDRLLGLLTKIQKALGDYLDKQRAAFPRFYFVGDEDLLEIIGNAKDVTKVQKHIAKMFSAIAALQLHGNGDDVTVGGMLSSEGEVVEFRNAVDTKAAPQVPAWLTQVESQMRTTLAMLLSEALHSLLEVRAGVVDGKWETNTDAVLEWIGKYPAQLIVLCVQVIWTESVEASLNNMDDLESNIESLLALLANSVLGELTPITRKKHEHLIVELVRERDVIRDLADVGVESVRDFAWLRHLRLYWNELESDPLQRLTICMADATFHYGFEYYGVADRLVHTPLTDRCYLTLTQALRAGMGGSPFGPAGTGKTETVKVLAMQLGVKCVVVNCDSAFDFQAMGRMFVGLCHCGAWGCFDEFNRLEERILSAVSQQILSIQGAIQTQQKTIELLGRIVPLNSAMGIFITMNPGYAGRVALPDNLKSLFRNQAMVAPDREVIAQVMLYSQGFRTAERLARKIVPLFKLCDEQLSNQSHYDFGLRALKSVLTSAGNMKRNAIHESSSKESSIGEEVVVIQAIEETMVPKLIAEDIPLLYSLLGDVFPEAERKAPDMGPLGDAITEVCAKHDHVMEDSWVAKLFQLHQIQAIHHGFMLVGPSGTGKTAAWKTLLEAMEKVTGTKTRSYVLDPKTISKDELFGTLDSTTREWTDGLFTHILRKVIDSARGENEMNHWIVFDGDVDPVWVESLNSTLDDNKLLTLPNGERLSLPGNVRVVFEVQDLTYATLATVSRCGMVWFSDMTLSVESILARYLALLRTVPVTDSVDLNRDQVLAIQTQFASVLQPHALDNDSLVLVTLDWVSHRTEHIMEYTRMRVLTALFTLLNGAVRALMEHHASQPEIELSTEFIEAFAGRRLLLALLWGLGGSLPLRIRTEFAKYLTTVSTISGPPSDNDTLSLLDYEVSLEQGCSWSLYADRVPTTEVESHRVAASDVVVPTVDTVRHHDVVGGWLAEQRPLVLCGPPGSGKTMTLLATLRAMPEYSVVGINFSSTTTPELVLKTLYQYCETKNTPKGPVMKPTQSGKRLVVFCDEINLPSRDQYGTQRVVSFLRQLVEHGGYWRTKDHVWVTLERVQFVGACNPPTDPGRVPMSPRFLRHAPVLLVDYPAPSSLKQIYGTFNRALLRLAPEHRVLAVPLTNAMTDFYLTNQSRFTTELYSHYVYSPRELSRWVRALYEGIKPLDEVSGEAVVRLWAHEALRLFQDRLVCAEETKWVEETLDRVAQEHFTMVNVVVALERPILFSSWMNRVYVPVKRAELRRFVRARLRVFYEEEMDVPLVLFNEVLDHVLRIDRIVRQPQGHCLLIGVAGCGRHVLTRFVAWMNGLSVFQIKCSRKYGGDDFDEDLRSVMKRAGCKGEKIVFIFDESNALSSSFLERMNALLASGEVPGLFEGENLASLMHECTVAAQHDGKMLTTDDELYRWFTDQIQKNLHVVFTMNPENPDFKNKAATSPALFNRCVIDWFGDWSDAALYNVAQEFTEQVDIEEESSEYVPPTLLPPPADKLADVLPESLTVRDALPATMVCIHESVRRANRRLALSQGRLNYVTPRHFLDFIQHYTTLYDEKRSEMEETQLHVSSGLQRLADTSARVLELQQDLEVKRRELVVKQSAAEEKLKQMVSDQQEAETKQTASRELGEQLAKKNEVIEVQKGEAQRDLDKAEPALLEAARSVKGIKKKHLDEIRAFANPPGPIKATVEVVAYMLGQQDLEWKALRGVIRRDDFIPSIVNFESSKLTEKVRQKIRNDYIDADRINPDVVNRASKACGPLSMWAVAQINYSEIADRVQPLRDEVSRLERESLELSQQQQALDDMIKELEASIEGYKREYALLITETEKIKTEINGVEGKVQRSENLVSGLSRERERWGGESETFKERSRTMIGDVLLCAAFLAYGGFFDQQYRSTLLHWWMQRLDDFGMRYDADLNAVTFLSTADDRLDWQGHSLPDDDLCVENAIMLQRFGRAPLVIDPSGQASEYLMQQYADKSIVRTSFLDHDAFMKNLESALRFGTPLLVQDAEFLDQLLNPILNKEIRRTGGRALVRLGDQDIDASPAFKLFLSTNDPRVNFPPDLCSRVTIVNFTVTMAGLQSQCMSQVLRSERPDISKRRGELLLVQGELQARLRSLEKSLLRVLAEARGNILDDDRVLATLERLKTEVSEVKEKSEDANRVMSELSIVSSVYAPLASSCSQVYFTLEQMAHIHYLYQFSLQFFQSAFSHVLGSAKSREKEEDTERVEVLMDGLFRETFHRVGRGLHNEDLITLALRLVQIRLKDTPQEFNDAEVSFMLEGRVLNSDVQPHPLFDGLADCIPDVKMRAQLSALVDTVPAMSKIADDVAQSTDEWGAFMQSPRAERCVPECVAKTSPHRPVQLLRELIIVRLLRPDCLLDSARILIEAVLGDGFLDVSYGLASVVESEMAADTPLLLCSAPGFDASRQVDELAKGRGKYEALALGAEESFAAATRAVTKASKNGTWILLKNVHLAPQWLMDLEKRLRSMKPSTSFRLFMTAEISDKLPSTVLRLCSKMVLEPLPGLKASVQRTLSSVPVDRMGKPPVERVRLYFMVAWLHALLLERVRYCPLGWSKPYEFSQAEQGAAFDVIDAWIDNEAGNRDNLDPQRIPWAALRTLLGAIYGGRMDNDFDSRVLNVLLEKIFIPQSYDQGFPLVTTREGVTVTAPEGTKRSSFVEWVNQLSDTHSRSPMWLGLPPDADSLVLKQSGDRVLQKVLRMQMLDDDSETVEMGEGVEEVGRPAWMQSLASSAREWLEVLPATTPPFITVSDDSDMWAPLRRVFSREVRECTALLDQVRTDVSELVAACDGERHMTNRLRAIAESLSQGSVPQEWMVYVVHDSMTVTEWITDFSARVKQLISINGEMEGMIGQTTPLWIGGLFHPDAYVTAVRQASARGSGASLETLKLSLELGSASVDGSDVVLRGIVMHGVVWSGGELELGLGKPHALGPCIMRWGVEGGQGIVLPVYLNASRKQMLFHVPLPSTLSSGVMAECGASLSIQ